MSSQGGNMASPTASTITVVFSFSKTGMPTRPPAPSVSPTRTVSVPRFVTENWPPKDTCADASPTHSAPHRSSAPMIPVILPKVFLRRCV